MTENKVTLNKLQFETKISISVTYKERELLVYNNYTNLLYTPKKDLEFSLIKKILGNTGNVFLKDLTEKLNPVLVFIDNLDITTTDDLNKELLIPLKQILPKSKIIENLEGLNRYESSKFSLNNFRKVSLQTLSELESLHIKKLEELNKSNNDSVLMLNEYKNKSLEKYNSFFSELNQILKEKNIQIDEESVKKLKEKVSNKANSKSQNQLANEVFRELSELDIKYEDIIGTEYVCKGRNNGCSFNGTVWGSNPYTTDSNMCRAAFHGGLVGPEGGFFHVKPIGSQTGYTGSTQNDIVSTSWQTWDGNSYHKTFMDIDFDISKHNYCGKYIEN